MNDQPLEVRTIVSMPVEENTYIAWLPGRKDALVIDPGFEPEAVLRCLQGEGLTAAAILNTHGHPDHIAGNESLKGAFPHAPLIIGVNEAHLLTDPEANLSAMFGFALVSPPADRTVDEGDILEIAGITLEVLEIPGHSPGHVVYVYRGPAPMVFGGDVLFKGSVGRTDFPGGSSDMLLSGIREKLFSLPPETVVYSGHGPATTLGEERRTNPFLR